MQLALLPGTEELDRREGGMFDFSYSLTVRSVVFQFLSAVYCLLAALVGRRKRNEDTYVEFRPFEATTEKAGGGNIDSDVIIGGSTAMKKKNRSLVMGWSKGSTATSRPRKSPIRSRILLCRTLGNPLLSTAECGQRRASPCFHVAQKPP